MLQYYNNKYFEDYKEVGTIDDQLQNQLKRQI